MDVRAMEFKNEQFDFIIDKGLFDSILVLLILFNIKVWRNVEKKYH